MMMNRNEHIILLGSFRVGPQHTSSAAQCLVNASREMSVYFVAHSMSIYVHGVTSTEPPSILLGLSEAPPNVAQGGSLTLSCPAEGHPHPFIAWRKDGQAMFFQEDGSSQDDENIRLMNDSSIRITSAGLEHSVAYECIAINEVGRDTHVFPLTVQSKGFCHFSSLLPWW